MTMLANGRLELVHSIPGRLRLRWRGDADLPDELLTDLQHQPAIRRVDYRPATRSLVLHHSTLLDLDDLETAAEPYGISIAAEAAPSARTPPPANGGPSKWEWAIADLEAVITLGLMVSWIRDLILRRAVRISTVLLLVLMAASLFQFWERRRQRQPEEQMEAEGLELLAS